jgi:hypothetical protein
VLVELAELLLAAGCDAADLVFREAAAHEELTGGSRDRVAQCIEGRIRVERAREWPSLDAIERLVAARDALGPAGA